jgi:hypothetical protein
MTEAGSRRLLVVFVAAATLSFVGVSAVLAVGGGAQNGEDTGCCGWTGADNPAPGTQANFSYANVTHNLILSEWIEPSHDWVRNRTMIWSQGPEDYLDANASNRALDYEIRIHDQFYYNFVANWSTNLPISKAPENENPIEELAQGYTEVDMEQYDPALINANVHYFWDQQFNSEKTAIPQWPDFYSEVEWCTKSFALVEYDVTGWMEKKVDQQ